MDWLYTGVSPIAKFPIHDSWTKGDFFFFPVTHPFQLY